MNFDVTNTPRFTDRVSIVGITAADEVAQVLMEMNRNFNGHLERVSKLITAPSATAPDSVATLPLFYGDSPSNTVITNFNTRMLDIQTKLAALCTDVRLMLDDAGLGK